MLTNVDIYTQTNSHTIDFLTKQFTLQSHRLEKEERTKKLRLMRLIVSFRWNNNNQNPKR